MYSAWTAHLKTPEDKERFEKDVAYFLNSSVVARLIQLLSQKLDNIDKDERTVESYSCPSWPYRQAHYNGTRQGVKTAIDLLTTKE